MASDSSRTDAYVQSLVTQFVAVDQVMAREGYHPSGDVFAGALEKDVFDFLCVRLVRGSVGLGTEATGKQDGKVRERRLPGGGRIPAFVNVPEREVHQLGRRLVIREVARANTPNWDLVVSCEIEGRKGLVLVEAKANVPELSEAPKGLRKPEKDEPEDSPGMQRSRENHDQIGLAIVSAREALSSQFPGVAIDRDRHYQLSNRIAFAWKLAAEGVPVVLVYLGFTGDAAVRGTEHQFIDDDHGRSAFRDHLSGVGAVAMLDNRIPVGDSAFWLLCRSRQVLTKV